MERISETIVQIVKQAQIWCESSSGGSVKNTSAKQKFKMVAIFQDCRYKAKVN